MLLQNDLEALIQFRKGAHGLGKRIVMAGGTFDLLHPGHLSYLAYARTLGEVLLVALNGDEAVRQLKGPGRPIFNQMARAEMVQAIRFVDAVYIHPEVTMVAVLLALRPDIYVKGQDYAEKTIPWTSDVKAYGGEVRIMPNDPECSRYSSSIIIERIVQNFTSKNKQRS